MLAFKVKGKWLVNAGTAGLDLYAGFWAAVGTYSINFGNPKAAAVCYGMAGASFGGARLVNYLTNKQKEEWKKEYDFKQNKKMGNKHKPKQNKKITGPKNPIDNYELPKTDADFDFDRIAARDAIDILSLNKMKSAAKALANLLYYGEHEKIESNLYKTLDGLKNGEVNLETYNDGKIFYEVADKLKTAGVIPGADLKDYRVFAERECFVPDVEDSIDNTYYENDQYMVEPGVPELNEDNTIVEAPKKRGIHSLIPNKPTNKNNQDEHDA